MTSKAIPKTDNKFDPTKSTLYMHEYGHYIQSQKLGFSYLFKVGIPSLKSFNKDPDNHHNQSYEVNANIEAYNYFKKKTNYIEWDFEQHPLHYLGTPFY